MLYFRFNSRGIVLWVNEHSQCSRFRKQLVKYLKPLRRYLNVQRRYASQITSWPVQAPDKYSP